MVDHPSRFDPTKRYTRVLWTGEERHAHSHDFNDAQSLLGHRLKGLADAMMDDGAVIDGGAISVDRDTGEVRVAAGRVYAGGIVHELTEATFTIPTTGRHLVGLCVETRIVSYLEDPELKGQILGTRAFGEPGADREQITARWTFEGDASCDGTFYAVYTIVDGQVITPTPPPTFVFNDALARYDREMNGHYIVKGWKVKALGPRADGEGRTVQHYSISGGTINVWGYKIDRDYDYRLEVVEEPDIAEIDAEPHVATGVGADGAVTITLNHGPVTRVIGVTVLKTVEADVTHGPYSGASDTLWHDGVAEIVSVTQGATTYQVGADYVHAGDAIDWSPGGQEPAPGSTYHVVYRYLDTVAPDATTATGLTVSGATEGSTIIVHYEWALPRIDVIAVDREGAVSLVKGEAARVAPWPPRIANDLIPLAEITNRWGETPLVRNTRTQSVHFNQIVNMEAILDDLYDLVAQNRLEKDLLARDVVAKRGLFVDPFLDDDMRDQGLAQSGAIVNEALQLAIEGGPEDRVLGDEPFMLPWTEETVLAQELTTGCMKINPYMVFQPLPGTLTLEPAVDFWITHETEWLSDITRVFEMGTRVGGGIEREEEVREVRVAQREDEHLRVRDVTFAIEGFGAGERLESFTFDGIAITTRGGRS